MKIKYILTVFFIVCLTNGAALADGNALSFFESAKIDFNSSLLLQQSEIEGAFAMRCADVSAQEKVFSALLIGAVVKRNTEEYFSYNLYGAKEGVDYENLTHDLAVDLKSDIAILLADPNSFKTKVDNSEGSFQLDYFDKRMGVRTRIRKGEDGRPILRTNSVMIPAISPPIPGGVIELEDLLYCRIVKTL